jgi:hypothetical protein
VADAEHRRHDSTTINREAPAAVSQLDRELTLAVGKKVHDESAVL